MKIERISQQQFEQFWPVFQAIAAAQQTYAIDPDINFQDAYSYWCLAPQRCYAARINGRVAASYYLKPNAAGPGAHICNCGYMVASEFRGQGLARALCEHSQQLARELGYRAMQFNSVVSTNEAAVHLWKSLGFSIIGTIPEAYNHKSLGYVDAYVMYKKLS